MRGVVVQMRVLFLGSAHNGIDQWNKQGGGIFSCNPKMIMSDFPKIDMSSASIDFRPSEDGGMTKRASGRIRFLMCLSRPGATHWDGFDVPTSNAATVSPISGLP